MADANKASEDYLTTPAGRRIRLRPAGKRSEVVIGPVAKALGKKTQAKNAASPSERPSRPGKTSTEPPS